MSIFLEDLSAEQVLVFDRKSAPYQRMVRTIMKELYGVEKFKTISEYRIADYYLDLGKYSYFDLSEEDYNLLAKIDCHEIITRDRWLRELTADESLRKVKECFKFCVDFFKEHKYTYVFTQIVDNYVMDIFVKVAWLFKIRVVGLVPFFVDGYYRVTIYGEQNDVRTVSDAEVGHVQKVLMNEKFVTSMAPSFSLSLKNTFILYIKYKMKCLIHFGFYRKVLGKNEFDYNAIFKENPYPKSFRYLLAFRFCKKLTHVKTWLAKNKKPVVYMPLHYFPEATIDYWSSTAATNYLQSIVEVLTVLRARGYRVLIKEHPAMAFVRSSAFYKDLLKAGKEDVVLCTPFVTSREIFSFVDKVVVWTGSVGVEAALYGLPVVKVSESYYSRHRKFMDFHFIDKAEPFSAEEKVELLREVLSGTVHL